MPTAMWPWQATPAESARAPASVLPPSLPALARALITPGAFTAEAVAGALYELRRVVQVWRVAPAGASPSVGDEAHLAVAMVRHALDRMQRLQAAYGEWNVFEPGAYFDLTLAQSRLLVNVVEGSTAVRITVYADLLLPRVQRALTTWATFDSTEDSAAQVVAQARMVNAWHEAVAVTAATRRLLAADIGYLAANAAQDERRRRLSNPASGDLLRLPRWLGGADSGPPPTLTLSIDFPLPAWRQPGRRRRLIRARAIRLARRSRGQGSGDGG